MSCIVWLWNLVSHFERGAQNKVLRKIFRTNRGEITGECRKLQKC